MITQIQYRKSLPRGYMGMNSEASKELGIPFKHNSNVIEVKKSLPKHVRVNTIRHEEIERYLMKNKNMRYKHAHKLSLKFEKLNKPFPEKNINRELVKLGILKE